MQYCITRIINICTFYKKLLTHNNLWHVPCIGWVFKNPKISWERPRMHFKLLCNFKTCIIIADRHSSSEKCKARATGFIFLLPSASWHASVCTMHASWTFLCVSFLYPLPDCSMHIIALVWDVLIVEALLTLFFARKFWHKWKQNIVAHLLCTYS